jgi:hypothetical protein
MTRSFDKDMMVLLQTRVECTAKIAMSALRSEHATTCLLPDRVLTRRIFLLGRAVQDC